MQLLIPAWDTCSRHQSPKLWHDITYSISQEICTRFLLCCALLWLYIDWFSHIHQAYFTGTVANDCPSASKATLMNMDKYFMWIHYEWFHNHNKAKHNKTVCIFLGIYCTDKLYHDTAYNTSSLMSFYHAMTGLHYIWLIFEKLKDETIAKFNKHWLR